VLLLHSMMSARRASQSFASRMRARQGTLSKTDEIRGRISEGAAATKSGGGLRSSFFPKKRKKNLLKRSYSKKNKKTTSEIWSQRCGNDIWPLSIAYA
jgi:hypothetical protein